MDLELVVLVAFLDPDAPVPAADVIVPDVEPDVDAEVVAAAESVVAAALSESVDVAVSDEDEESVMVVF